MNLLKKKINKKHYKKSNLKIIINKKKKMNFNQKKNNLS